MGRAMVRSPEVFLLDEPLSNLDAQLRAQVRADIGSLQRDLGTTTLYVTHDQLEALTLGDLVAVLDRGKLQQVAEPGEIYDRPANVFVARFIGSPPMNVLDAPVLSAAWGRYVEFGGCRLRLEGSMRGLESGSVTIGIRPENLEVIDASESGDRHFGVTSMIDLYEVAGSEAYVYFSVGGVDNSGVCGTGAAQGLSARASAAKWVARVSARKPLKKGLAMRALIDPRSLQLFNSTTGDAIADGPTMTHAASGFG